MSACTSCGCGVDACGCCAGIETATPKPVGGPPGLTMLPVRIGRHGDFLASMLARLSSHGLADGGAPLKGLRTRQPDDLTISLLDAFAAAGDVLAFYNERIANEGYLPTATEFRSVEALARLVGYRPQPGLAASVFLAFGIDPNTPGSVRIDEGLGVKTIPGQDESPQVFETSAALEARAEWNEIRLRKSAPQRIDPSADGSLWLAGTDTRLKPGDALLVELSANDAPVPIRALEIVADMIAGVTRVRFEPWFNPPLNDPTLKALTDKGAVLGGVHAPAVIAAAREVQEMPRADALEPLTALAADARNRARLLNLQPSHQEVLANIARRSEEMAAELAQAAGTGAPPSPAHQPDSFGDWLGRLAAAPSTPPASAARIVRDTEKSFTSSSAASLDVVAKASPAAGRHLAAAVEGFTRAAPAYPLRVYAMRIRAGLFGRTFPKRMEALTGTGQLQEVGEWPIIIDNRTAISGREQPDLITLDATYDGIAANSWMLVDMRGIEKPAGDGSVRVGPVRDVLVTRAYQVYPKSARADYGGSGESTALRLVPSSPWIRYRERDDSSGANHPQFMASGRNEQDLLNREFQLIRRTTVYAAPEELVLAQQPIEGDFCVHGSEPVELASLYAGLTPGRYVIVSGERTDIPGTQGVRASEVAMIAGISHDVGREAFANRRGEPLPGERIHSFVTFAKPLSYCYKRDSVVIFGNVVKATHGETKRELLGSGDASKPNLQFDLKQAPLTFLAAPTARGAEAALQIWVDDIRWHEAEDLIEACPTDRLYLLHTSEGGKATVQFGDGDEGARPASGVQNIRAVYRTGIGRPGNARAGQISQLVSRPAGLRDVVNPLAASGGADPEDRDQVRRHAPLATMALDRLVSVEDHASFAVNFAGIAKARARMMSDGARRFVHVTVAAEDDAPLDPGSDLMIALKHAFIRFGDPYSPVLLAPRELRLLIIAAKIALEPDRLWEAVVADVRARLVRRLGFDEREIAAGLAASEIVATIQQTPGVAYVDLDTFGSIPTVGGDAGKRAPLAPEAIAAEIERVTRAGVASWEPSLPARAGTGGLLAAELLLLAPDIPDTLILNELR